MSRKRTIMGDTTFSKRGPNPALQRALRKELAALDFAGFAKCAGLALRASGYRDVQVRRTGKDGRNRDGGWDMDANFRAGLLSMKAIAQVKQYDGVPVQKRYVDELRGSMLRSGAHQGILITLSTFSEAAKAAAACGTIAPVHLIDGEELTEVLIAHGIGVAEGGRGSLRIDKRFFGGLEDPGQGRREPASDSRSLVTIVVIQANRPARIEWGEKRPSDGRTP